MLFNPFDVIEDSSVSLENLELQVRLIFKKILKKQVSTRLNGLDDLAKWLQTCNEQEFVNIRPHFVNQPPFLSMNNTIFR